MEIKSQNMSKMSNEQLYQLVVQKEISDTDRAMVKDELVKREAEVLYNQAKRARAGEITPIPTGMLAKGQGAGTGAKKKPRISLTMWLFIILVLIVLAAVVYAMVTP